MVDGCTEKTLASPISYETPLTIYGIGVVRTGMTLTEVVQATGHTASFPFEEVEFDFDFSDGSCFHAIWTAPM